MCQDIGDGSGVLAWAAGAAVADVGDPGCGSGVFDEDLALQVGDGDCVAGLVAVGDDEDLLEASSPVDLVLDFVQVEHAAAGQRLDDSVGRQIGRYWCGSALAGLAGSSLSPAGTSG